MAASKIDLFSLATYSNELIASEYIKLTAELKEFPIKFRLKDNKEYVDLSETVLRLKVKVTNADGTAIVEAINNVANQVALTNNALHSVFSEVKIFLNSKLIEGRETMYGIKAYLDTVLRFHAEAMKNQLFAQGFEKEEATKIDEVTNTSFVKRRA